MWGSEFWAKGYFVNTLGPKENQEKIASYVKQHRRKEEYRRLYREQL